MRSNAAEYGILSPASLDEALEVLATEHVMPIAGGTEIMVALGAGRLTQKQFVSLHRIPELRFIDTEDRDVLRIGAGVTFTDLRRSEVIAREFPLLVQTASWTGSVANQNRGTLGGNIANASPAADTPPALLAYGAELELVSTHGIRTLSYSAFHLGYKRTAMSPAELILAIRLHRRFLGHRHWIRKVGTRNAQAISKVALAAVAKIEDGIFQELALGAASLQDRPCRLAATEAALLGRDPRDAAAMRAARSALAGEIAPIDDIRSSARYRAAVAANLLEEFVTSCFV